MNREEIIEQLTPEDNVIFLDPEVFDKGIIGITEDNCHLIYDFNKLVEALAEDYKQHPSEIDDEETDYETEAIEWLEVNTIPSLPYMDAEYRPIIMMPLEEA